MALLQIQLLGGCEFRDRAGRPLPLTARKCRALLAFLALQAGAPQSREKLAALFWEDTDAELARTSLRQALSAIRRALPEPARTVLVADAMQVSLDVSKLDVDVLELRSLLAESTQASLKAAQSRAAGGLLDGFDARSDAFEEWLLAERRSLRRDLSSAMQMLVRLCREAGDIDGEIDALSRLIALEPINEPAHRELMDANARAGRYTDALRQYQQCRAILQRELDLSPEPATDALYRELMKRRRAVSEPGVDALRAEFEEDDTDTAPPGDERMLRNGVVLTARLIGLADYRRGLDPETARTLTQRLQESFAARVAEHGGVADRLAGDRVHAVFGLERLSGNEPHRALRTAQALHQAFADSRLPLPGIAIGVAQGPLLPERENGPFPLAGHPMSEAEALALHAAPGETLLADDLRRALHPRAVPFAGRHAELSLTVSLFERSVAARRGRTILIRGEAGIGKTRLLEELAEAAKARGASCHRVQVLDFGQVKARRPLAALFSSLLGIGPEATPEDRRRAIDDAVVSGKLHPDDILHASGLADAPLSPDQVSIERNVDAQALEHGRLDAVRRMIEASCKATPLLLVIEDLHYAGGEEAARLGELAATVASLPALFVMSTRPEEDPIDAAWRARARGCPLTTLDLAPLSDDEARELAASYPQVPEALAADCIARAQGHPLFLDQLLRAADAGERALPATVQALVLSRMERLERADRQTLIAASVLGLRFPRDALAAMQDAPSASIDSLVDEGLLAIDGGEIAFVHALMREAVYESLLNSNRRELHARAAAWYAARDLGLRAGHLAEARDPRAPRAYLDAAAAEADSLRLDRALEFAHKASELARDPVDFALSRCLLGELLTRSGHTHDAIATLREVIDLRPDALTEARARIGLANALRILDRYDEALGALDRAESSLAGHDRPELLARIWSLRGNIHFPRGKLDDCLAAHERALEFARKAKSPVDEARAQGGLGDARYQRGHMQRARDHFARCVAEAQECGAVGLALSHAPMLGITRAYCGEIRQGLADLASAVAAASRVGDPRSELIGRVAEATVALCCSEYDLVRRVCERGLALSRQLGARRFEAELMSLSGHALGESGGVADAQVLLHQASTLALEAAATYCGPWCLAVQALFTPNNERAKEMLAQGEALLAQGCVSHNHLEFHRLAMEFHVRHQQFPEVRRHAAALTAYTKEEPLPWSEIVVRRGEWLADRSEDPSSADLAARRATLLADIDAMDFRWLRRGL